jgi:hypothetical protein
VTVTNLVDARNISSATNYTLTVTNVQMTNSGFYYLVIVTNYGGSVTSSPALLTVLAFPVIEVQPTPTNQVMAVGSTAAFFVNAIGTVPLHYQWWLNGTNLVKNGTIKNGPTISGATTNVLIIRNVQTDDSGSYTVSVTNIDGSATSSAAVLTVTNVPPTIVTQPTSQTNGVGTTVTLAVTATGTSPLSYQWQVGGMNLVNGAVKNGPTISGATTNVLTIKNVQLTNSGSYTVIVTNYGGSVTSSNAVLTVLSSPVIVSLQPTNQAMAVGSNASFTVTAIGTVPLHYQWWVNGTNLVKNGSHKNGPIFSGATTTNLTIKNVQMTNSGSYTVVVTNIAGSVISSNLTLTVTNIPPAITRQPLSQTNGVGTIVTFTVTATGTAPLSYQWQVNGTNLVNGAVKNGPTISGVTTTNLTIKNVQTNNSGNYTVIVTNFGGAVTSSVALLTMQTTPLITVQPTNQTIAVGSKATFSVTAIGTVPLRYHWQLNGTNLVNGGHISGATTANLTIKNARTNDSGNYTVVVTNLAGSVTSSNAVLTVASSPVITIQPTNQTMAVGSKATFTVTAIGTGPLSYHWQVNGTDLVNGSNISGATTNVLTIYPAQTTNSGSYTVIVANHAGSVTSSNALLTVTNIATVISPQPTDQTVGVGSTATFSINGTAQRPFFLQWLKDGTNLTNGPTISGSIISGATTVTLHITNAQTNDSGTYWIVVSNAWGSLASSNAILTVATSPVIVTQPTPTNQAMAVGSTAILAVTAAGTEPLSYQWQMNGTNLVDGTNLVNGDITSGSTTNVLTISNVQTTNSGNYTVIVTNVVGSVTSSNAVLTVTNVPPEITQQPADQTVAVGSNVTFSVSATGTEPLSYQWQLNGTNLVDGGNIINSTTTNLIISNVQLTDDGGNYTVIVTNLAGSVTSSNAVLTVTTNMGLFIMQPINQKVAPLSFANIVAAPGSGGGFILSGAGGVTDGTYYVLISSNLLLPPTNWTCIATNQFDSEGDFIFTNTVQTNAPHLFYLLQLP